MRRGEGHNLKKNKCLQMLGILNNVNENKLYPKTVSTDSI